MKNEDRITEILSSKGDIKTETLEKIEGSVPALSERQKDRIYDLVMQKKYDNKAEKDTDAEETENSISIVPEKRRNNIMIKMIAAAACICLVFGSVVFTNGRKKDDSDRFDKVQNTTVFDTSEKYTDYAVTSVSETEKIPAKAVTVVEKVSSPEFTGSAADTGKAPETTQSFAVTAAKTETPAATSAVTEAAAEANETMRSVYEEAAHKLTDDYWDYECFFHEYQPDTFSTSSEFITFKYTFKSIYENEERTDEYTLRYMKTTDERLTEKTMDGLKKLFNTYYSKNYDPIYSFHPFGSRDTYIKINYGIFGPSFTADTLPADGRLDRCYTFIEYEGELYENIGSPSQYFGSNWPDDQIDITDVTENSFTLKRKKNKPGETRNEYTFKIVFDEDVQDWRIEQIDQEYDYNYPYTAVTGD
ncbi:MAG: hypothetical protein J5864_08085 [Oscillospiraceae bacterium]|nr:hypothetical protein [Oscillospiraceae bacterium]